MLPKIKSYGHYSSSNYGVHTLKVSLGNIILYYSYDTIVAYEDLEDRLVICENVWTRTTGKHLNMISQNKVRTPYHIFKKKLEAALARHIV